MSISEVTLRLVGSKADGPLLVADEDRPLAMRIFRSEDPKLKGKKAVPGRRPGGYLSQ